MPLEYFLCHDSQQCVASRLRSEKLTCIQQASVRLCSLSLLSYVFLFNFLLGPCYCTDERGHILSIHPVDKLLNELMTNSCWQYKTWHKVSMSCIWLDVLLCIDGEANLPPHAWLVIYITLAFFPTTDGTIKWEAQPPWECSVFECRLSETSGGDGVFGYEAKITELFWLKALFFAGITSHAPSHCKPFKCIEMHQVLLLFCNSVDRIWWGEARQ